MHFQANVPARFPLFSMKPKGFMNAASGEAAHSPGATKL